MTKKDNFQAATNSKGILVGGAIAATAVAAVGIGIGVNHNTEKTASNNKNNNEVQKKQSEDEQIEKSKKSSEKILDKIKDKTSKDSTSSTTDKKSDNKIPDTDESKAPETNTEVTQINNASTQPVVTQTAAETSMAPSQTTNSPTSNTPNSTPVNNNPTNNNGWNKPASKPGNKPTDNGKSKPSDKPGNNDKVDSKDKIPLESNENGNKNDGKTNPADKNSNGDLDTDISCPPDTGNANPSDKTDNGDLDTNISCPPDTNDKGNNDNGNANSSDQTDKSDTDNGDTDNSNINPSDKTDNGDTDNGTNPSDKNNNGELKELLVKQKNAKNSLKELQKEIDTTTSAIQDKKLEITAAKNNVDNFISQNKAILDKSNQDIASKQNEIKDIQKQINYLQKEIDAETERLAKLSTAITPNFEKDNLIYATQFKVKQASTQISSLTNQLASKQNDLQALETEKNTAVADLQAQLNTASPSDKLDIKAEIDNLNTQFLIDSADLQDDINTLTDQLTTQQGLLATAQSDLAAAQALPDSIAPVIDQTTLINYQTQLSDEKAKLDTANAELSQLQADAQSNNGLLTALQNTLLGLNTEKAELENQLSQQKTNYQKTLKDELEIDLKVSQKQREAENDKKSYDADSFKKGNETGQDKNTEDIIYNTGQKSTDGHSKSEIIDIANKELIKAKSNNQDLINKLANKNNSSTSILSDISKAIQDVKENLLAQNKHFDQSMDAIKQIATNEKEVTATYHGVENELTKLDDNLDNLDTLGDILLKYIPFSVLSELFDLDYNAKGNLEDFTNEEIINALINYYNMAYRYKDLSLKEITELYNSKLIRYGFDDGPVQKEKSPYDVGDFDYTNVDKMLEKYPVYTPYIKLASTEATNQTELSSLGALVNAVYDQEKPYDNESYGASYEALLDGLESSIKLLLPNIITGQVYNDAGDLRWSENERDPKNIHENAEKVAEYTTALLDSKHDYEGEVISVILSKDTLKYSNGIKSTVEFIVSYLHTKVLNDVYNQLADGNINKDFYVSIGIQVNEDGSGEIAFNFLSKDK